ncbi:MAG: hypothetical protein KAJ21_05465 [Thermoplasmatales archaeon]|nr:hypothetical protein [Thermoplasmatales archaeon]
MEKGGIIGLIYGIILLILGIAGLVNKANLCSYYVAAFLLILGMLALIFGFYFGREKK